MFVNMRRLFDMLCATVGLFLLTPLLLLVALAIKVEDGGTVLYAQPRMGLGFRKFRLLKFRSMVSGAEGKSLITAANDDRVTAVGRFIRRYKLDELPQLINVLTGDMALVGSRPEVERYVEMFRPEYSELLQDRPGITDPASITFRDEQKEFANGDAEEEYVSRILPKKLELSLSYMRRRTFFSDLGILIRTMLGCGVGAGHSTRAGGESAPRNRAST